MGVYEIRTGHVLSNLQIDPESSDLRVCAGQLGGHKVGEDVWFVTRHPEAAHDYVEVRAQRSHQLGDVHSCPAVHLWRIFTANYIYAHG